MRRLGLVERSQSFTTGVRCTHSNGMLQIAGAIRNDGAGWYAINDTDHSPMNIKAVRSNLFSIEIEYPAAAKVGSLVIASDETLARVGIVAGASVGLSSAQIVLSRVGWFGPHQISPEAVSTKNYPLSNLWVYGVMLGECH